MGPPRACALAPTLAASLPASPLPASTQRLLFSVGAGPDAFSKSGPGRGAPPRHVQLSLGSCTCQAQRGPLSPWPWAWVGSLVRAAGAWVRLPAEAEAQAGPWTGRAVASTVRGAQGGSEHGVAVHVHTCPCVCVCACMRVPAVHMSCACVCVGLHLCTLVHTCHRASVCLFCLCVALCVHECLCAHVHTWL